MKSDGQQTTDHGWTGMKWGKGIKLPSAKTKVSGLTSYSSTGLKYDRVQFFLEKTVSGCLRSWSKSMLKENMQLSSAEDAGPQVACWCAQSMLL